MHHYGEQDGDSLKTKIELPYDPGIPFLGIYSEKILHSKTHTHPNVQSLGWKDPLEKGKATHSSVLAWRIHGLYSPQGGKESDTTERLSLHFTLMFIAALLAITRTWEEPKCPLTED